MDLVPMALIPEPASEEVDLSKGDEDTQQGDEGSTQRGHEVVLSSSSTATLNAGLEDIFAGLDMS